MQRIHFTSGYIATLYVIVYVKKIKNNLILKSNLNLDSSVQTKYNIQGIPKNEINNFENPFGRLIGQVYCIVKILGIAVICFLQLLIK